MPDRTMERRIAPGPAREAGPPTVVFDIYGTLLDVRRPIMRLEAEIGPCAGRLAEVWRSTLLEQMWATTLTGSNDAFWTLATRALRHAMLVADTPPLEGLAEALLDALRAPDPFADMVPLLEDLRAQDIRIVALSNAGPEVAGPALRSAGLLEPLSALLGVHPIGLYKPHPKAYALVSSAAGGDTAKVWFVSANDWDAVGAARFGLRSVWLDRDGRGTAYPATARLRTVTDARTLEGVMEEGSP